MGRGRGKGKKQSVFATTDDNRSGEDDKLPMKREGRPQKPVNDGVEEEAEFEKIEEDAKRLVFNKLAEYQAATENGKKRKRPSQVKETMESFKEENGNGAETTNGTDSIKSVGYRQVGSRRKNKRRRAAEVGVEEYQAATENGKKRKRPSQVKETMESFKEENGNGAETNGTDSIKSVGYRQVGSRRKNKPRRAAEVGVECL